MPTSAPSQSPSFNFFAQSAPSPSAQTHAQPQDRLRSRSGKARRKQVRRTATATTHSPSTPHTVLDEDDWLAFRTHQVQLVRVKEVRSSNSFKLDAAPPILASLSAAASCSPAPSVCAFERLPNEVLERIFEYGEPRPACCPLHTCLPCIYSPSSRQALLPTHLPLAALGLRLFSRARTRPAGLSASAPPKRIRGLGVVHASDALPARQQAMGTRRGTGEPGMDLHSLRSPTLSVSPRSSSATSLSPRSPGSTPWVLSSQALPP